MNVRVLSIVLLVGVVGGVSAMEEGSNTVIPFSNITPSDVFPFSNSKNTKLSCIGKEVLCKMVVVVDNPKLMTVACVVGGNNYSQVSEKQRALFDILTDQIKNDGVGIDNIYSKCEVGILVTKAISERRFNAVVRSKFTSAKFNFLFGEFSKLKVLELLNVREKGKQLTRDIFNK